ncbi:hypothetical protein [Kibdelosporangium philippinense]|uniref:hypothetical protein n=1 Tax=Kibdelosporangium philippinense TaxID=211113 RepID=UPI00361CB73C
MPGSRVLAKPAVLTPDVRFELLVRDKVVFYNDTNSERAGVIQLDGKVINAAKYDANDPGRGLNGSATPSPPAQQTPGSSSAVPSSTAVQPSRGGSAVEPTQVVQQTSAGHAPPAPTPLSSESPPPPRLPPSRACLQRALRHRLHLRSRGWRSR